MDRHGVYIYENPTSLTPPVNADSAVQVVVGTAPVNMGTAVNPTDPQIAYSYKEAVDKMGMSGDFDTFTLCQSIQASFVVYGVAPVILINVLDPARHRNTVNALTVSLIGGKATVAQEGILPGSVVITDAEESTIYEPGTDYALSFSPEGYLVLEALGGMVGTTAQLQLSFDRLDPSMVTTADILEGINKITEVYPRFSITPGQLLCPGWSQLPEVYTAMLGKTRNLNSVFSCIALADIDTAEALAYDSVYGVKNQNGVVDENSIALWPKCRVGDQVYWMSAMAGAHIAFCDSQNENIPYVSPSNKQMRISGICQADGTEIILDMEQANLLNSQGICTAINLNGWKFWGNNTAAYPGNSDVKDRFIPVRRMFAWWGNTFILTYFKKVDDPLNPRLTEAVLDSENIRANGFKAQLKIAGAEIRIDPSLTDLDLMNGEIRFLQYLTPYPPAQAIINTLEFDPKALTAAVTGREA